MMKTRGTDFIDTLTVPPQAPSVRGLTAQGHQQSKHFQRSSDKSGLFWRL